MNEQDNAPDLDIDADGDEGGTQCSPSGKIPLLKRFEEVWAAYAPLLRPGLMLVVFFAALWLLHHEFKAMKYADVVASFHALSNGEILAAIGFTAANFMVLIGYDWFGVKLVKHEVTARQVTTAALLSYAFSNSLGVFLGGAPVRARLYSSWGMPSSEIVRLVLVIGVAFWLGLFSLAGTLFVFTPFDIPEKLHLPVSTSRPFGIALLLMTVVFLIICALRKSPLRIGSVNLQPPPLKIALAQMFVAMSDFILAAATLYVLLPDDVVIDFLPFVAIFVLAIFVALVSHVPGGLGILELVLIAMLPGGADDLVGALIAFRIIYYLLPLMIGVGAISFASIRQHQTKITGVLSDGLRWANIISPPIITGAVFVVGLVMLVSGTLPPSAGKLELIRDWVPLPLVEVSHFLGSVIGAVLIVLSRALQRRIDAAWWLTIVMLSAGVLVSLLKGFAWEQAILVAIMLVALLPCRQYFFRHGQIFATSWSARWLIAIAMTAGLIIWLILFSYRHVEYNNQLWWSFAYGKTGEAPRALRAAVGGASVLLIVGLMRLFRTTERVPDPATEKEMGQVETIIANDENTAANLALLGDKRFIFSGDDQAFVMFGSEGSSWVSMGDPVGPKESADEAAWKFREACDSQGKWPVFYQIDESCLSRYIEMGLSLLKLGEEAKVPLQDFSLKSCSRTVRRNHKKSLESGLRFEIVPQQQVPNWMPKLKEISDAWLGEKSAAEKGFSLGFFDETYLLHYDMAIVFDQDRPIAFANVWKGGTGVELSIDLMRHPPDAPRSVMEFLFIELMLWGHQQEYQWFSLGMAPLSGVDSHRLGPAWNRVSNVVYRHGEHFYNFQGLRAYKEKFHPVWFPKYLASPGGLATPQVLANVSTLISGGLIRLVKR
ncbi:bifunctional lysylphosphatidylglycerol flippase/synthetase MprF [bacterium]|nr:bifunctional lysylphosphatidylglycerol flippase/synthetase MprF [bacterium]